MIDAAGDLPTLSNPPAVAAPIGAYSHLAVTPPGASLLVVAGQIGNRQDGSVVEGVEAQYEQALRNIVAILASAGAEPKHLIKLTTFLTQPLAPERAGAIRRQVLGAVTPPSTLVYVAGLARPGLLVEVEATAVAPAK
jgi:enamine deaminase RidA (YjgF/YER057c/UK114 family)